MTLFLDPTNYCLHCGLILREGTTRCDECHRFARMPSWSWTTMILGIGLAGGWWAGIKGASLLGVLVSTLAITLLVGGLLIQVLRYPQLMQPRKTVHWGHTTLAILLGMEAACVPAYWATRESNEAGVSPIVELLLVFVVLPAIVVPLAVFSTRWRWGIAAYFPSCDQCNCSLSPKSKFCGACGAKA
jgi:hypothetical protein